MWQQAVRFEYQAHGAAIGGQIDAGTRVKEDLIVQQDAALRRLTEPGE